MIRVWLIVTTLFAGLGFAAWASDFITLQGERTVYTADCRGGAWQGERCSGEVVAGHRYRFRALPPHSEVIFWTAGTAEPSGKFSECKIRDGRNWLCQANADAHRSITLQMAEGLPVPGPADLTRPFRSVSKWRWLLLDRGWTQRDSVRSVAAAASAA